MTDPDHPPVTLNISDITIQARSRRDLRNIDSLAASITAVGVLNPPTVRWVDQQWVLVAGARRLAAMTHLHWTTTPVTIATTIEDELTALYAERDENTQRDDFSPSEMVAHADRIEERERDLAKQRQREHGGTAPGRPNTCADSAPVSPAPAHERKTRDRVAKAVGTSHDTLSKARHVINTATDPTTPPEVREVAQRAAANLAEPRAVVDREHRAVREAEQHHAQKTVIDSLDKHAPGAAANIARKALRARWSKAIAAVADIPLMDPAAIRSVLTDTEADVHRGLLTDLRAWVERFDHTRAPGLRVVREGTGE